MAAALSLILFVAGDRPATGTLAFLSALAWSWASHVALHVAEVPLLSGWHRDHHRQAAPGWGTCVTEFLLNSLLLSGVFWAFLLPPWLAHRPVTIYYALVYTSLHLLNYHGDGEAAGFHRQHHLDPRTNYGPAFMDALMGTHVPPFEDIRHYLPNMVLVAAAMATAGYIG